MLTDTFGNAIDPVSGFARGSIIASATEEGLRLKNAQKVAADRVRTLGPESIAIFSGNQRDYPIHPEDIDTLCEEWVGPGLFAEDLREAGLVHLGGNETHGVTIFNRTSAAIIASIIALSENSPVVSISPAGGRSHASVVHGTRLAGNELVNLQTDQDWLTSIWEHRPKLVVVTTVTSALERMAEEDIAKVVGEARKAGAMVFLDEAYGARIRPVLHGGRLSLQFDADLVVTNCDKAGLSGPRAGLLAGRSDLVARVSATGAGFGMEARAPIAAGALRSLQAYSPELLQAEAREGAELAAELSQCFPDGVVQTSDLGPMIHEDEILRDLLRRASLQSTDLVPSEVTSALGTLLLRDHGILTVNTHGQPGARVSLRLKPTGGAISRVGGVSAVVHALLQSSDDLASILSDQKAVSALVLGGNA